MVGADLFSIRQSLEGPQRYDESWAYSWNALEATLLVRLRDNRLHEFLCPVPDLILRRVTEGLFYDRGKSKLAFGNAYGHAFERYVGDVLRVQFSDSAIQHTV
jgi:hypothetical protein